MRASRVHREEGVDASESCLLGSIRDSAFTPDDLPDRLRSKIEVQDDGCWLWTASCRGKGYAGIWWNGGTRGAHRVVYEILVGPIPEGFTLDHKCRQRMCTNPECLEPVTNAENVLRGVGPTAQNARKTHCIHGHEFTPENTYAYRGGRVCRTCRRRPTTTSLAPAAALEMGTGADQPQGVVVAPVLLTLISGGQT